MHPMASYRFDELLAQIASRTPAPGGGATVCAVGALSAAQAQMVVAYSIGKKTLVEHDPELREAQSRLENTRKLYMEFADEDAAAYSRLNALMKLPEDDLARKSQYPKAVEEAIAIPRAALAASLNLLRLLERLASISNKYLASDLAISAILAESAARAAACNVRINLLLITDAQQHAKIETETGSSLETAAGRCRAVCELCT